MKIHPNSLRFLALASVAAAAPSGALAQNGADSEWNHFGADLRLGLNIQAKFGNSGAVAASAPAGPAGPAAGGAVSRAYNDGYVNVDSSGNQGGLTWNWGYQNSSQVSGGNLLMHSASSAGASSSAEDDPNLGFDLSYARDLGHFDWGRWGLKLAFGYTALDLRDSSSLGAAADLITDAYPLNGIQAPLAPYSGSFSGPGPVIGSAPARSTMLGEAIISGTREMNATLYDLRLGPYVDFPLGKGFSVQLGGGLALGVVGSKFSFAETTSISGAANQSAGSVGNTECLAGAYAEAELAYRISRPLSVFVGAQFQYLGDFQQNVGGRSAQLDLGQSVFTMVGLQWRF